MYWRTNIKTTFLVSFCLGFILPIYIEVFHPFKINDIIFIILSPLVLLNKYFKFHTIQILVLFISLIICFTTFHSIAINNYFDLNKVVKDLLNFIFSVYVFWVINSLSKKELSFFVIGFLFNMIIISFLSILSHFSFLPSFISSQESTFGTVPIGTFSDSSRFSFFLFIAFIILVNKYKYLSRNYLLKNFYAMSIIVVFFTIILVRQRACFIFMSLFILIFIFMNFANSFRMLKFNISFYFVIFLTILPFLFSYFPILDTVSKLSIYDKFLTKGISYTNDPRFLFFLNYLDFIYQNLFFGTGFSDTIVSLLDKSSHNTYLSFLKLGGIISLLLFSFILIFTLINSFYKYFKYNCFTNSILFYMTLFIIPYIFVINLVPNILFFSIVGLLTNENS